MNEKYSSEMIDRLIELVRIDVFEVLTILFFGVMVGVLPSRIYWKGEVAKRDSTIWGLEDYIEEKNVSIKKLHLAQVILKEQFEEIGNLNRLIQKSKSDRIKLSQEINEKVTELESDFKTQLENKEENIQTLNKQVNEKDESIGSLENKVVNLEENNQESVDLNEMLKTDLEEIEKSLEEKNKLIDLLKTNTKYLEEENQESVKQNIQLKSNLEGLEKSVEEKDEAIILLKTIAEKYEEKHQESVNLNMELNTNLEEMVISMEEKKKEISSTNARLSKMQDDFTHIVGIGPKVSSVLMSAGINSFTKLGSTDHDRLREVIEVTNPNILRLVDPSTWPEQARLASEENWEGLSELQESLKSNRRNRQQLVTPSVM